MDFMLGVNFWGSKAGTEMWINWDEKSIDDDLKVLSEYGVEYLRVFPNWRDFQPICAIRTEKGRLREYRLHGKYLPEDEFMLDEIMLSRFETFCALCEKHNLKLIVSLITGWMSGKLFYPPALENKNLITDPEALMFEAKFTRGFVHRFKNEKCIAAWDLGNECNCMGKTDDKNQAWLWVSNVRNAIKCEDDSRIVMAGMHGLTDMPENSAWSIQMLGELTDVLTPHPYPSPTTGGENDPMNEPKMSYIPTFQCEYYSALGNKPAMIQELGSFANIIGCEQTKCDYLRVNVYSALANDVKGFLWWCAHEQSELDFPPYEWTPLERELGLLYSDKSPKPVAKEMKKLSGVLKTLPKLPAKEIDGVFINIDTRNDGNFYDATAGYILAKQSGLNITFMSARDNFAVLPDSKLYIMPIHSMWSGIYRTHYENLKQKVYDGATLLITHDDGMINSFESFVGLESHGTSVNDKLVNVKFKDFTLTETYTGKELLLKKLTAEVLATSDDGNVMFSVNNYGKGKVYFANFPLEYNAYTSHRKLDRPKSFPYYKVYKTVADSILKDKPFTISEPLISATYHKISDNEYYATLINYSSKKLESGLTLNDYDMQIIYNNPYEINGCDMAVIKLTKK